VRHVNRQRGAPRMRTSEPARRHVGSTVPTTITITGLPYLEEDFYAVDEEEGDHYEEQHGVATVEHVLVEALWTNGQMLRQL
jgi:hypothetical protein